MWILKENNDKNHKEATGGGKGTNERRCSFLLKDAVYHCNLFTYSCVLQIIVSVGTQ